MSTKSPTNLLAITAFALALVGTALGFASFQHVERVALGLAQVEMVGATVTRKNLDTAHERIVALEERVARLETELAAARAAPAE